jgi:hypothetical protein
LLTSLSHPKLTTQSSARFVNLGQLWGPALAVAAYPPLRSFDLAHFVDKISVALHHPCLVTFESALPRMFPQMSASVMGDNRTPGRVVLDVAVLPKKRIGCSSDL